MLAIKRNMNKTDILHNVVLTDPPDRVVMRSAISQRARPRAGGGSTQQSVQTLEGGSASTTSSPLSVHTSTQNNSAVLHLTSQHYYLAAKAMSSIFNYKMLQFIDMCQNGMNSERKKSESLNIFYKQCSGFY